MKKTLSLLLLFVLVWQPLVFGQIPSAAESMRGMKGVKVDVILQFEKDTDAFDISFHRWMIEQRLRELGVNVVEVLPANPYDSAFQGSLVLIISPIVFAECRFIVHYRLELVQLVDISRDSSPSVGVTWEKTLLSSERDEAQPFDDRINDLVDMFANDYLKANPPEPRSGQGDE